MMHARGLIHVRTCAFVTAFVLVSMTVATNNTSAQPINGNAPWCVNLSQYGGTLDCAYHSLEQCMASALGVSNQCSLNPWYVGPPDPRARPRPRDPRAWRY